MPNTKRPSGTGNAQIVRQGQTASNRHGSNPDMRTKGGEATVRDLKAK